MDINCYRKGSIDRVALGGELSIYHVAEAKEPLLEKVRSNPLTEFDLSKISEVDSAGLQLLMVLKREAQARGTQMHIVGHSQPLVDMIQLFDLAGYFGDPVLLTVNPGAGDFVI